MEPLEKRKKFYEDDLGSKIGEWTFYRCVTFYITVTVTFCRCVICVCAHIFVTRGSKVNVLFYKYIYRGCPKLSIQSWNFHYQIGQVIHYFWNSFDLSTALQWPCYTAQCPIDWNSIPPGVSQRQPIDFIMLWKGKMRPYRQLDELYPSSVLCHLMRLFIMSPDSTLYYLMRLQCGCPYCSQALCYLRYGYTNLVLVVILKRLWTWPVWQYCGHALVNVVIKRFSSEVSWPVFISCSSHVNTCGGNAIKFHHGHHQRQTL